MAGYYDLVLGAIPLAAASIATGLFLGGVTASTAISLGCVAAAGLVGHAMFIRAPTGDASPAPAARSGTDPGFEMAD